MPLIAEFAVGESHKEAWACLKKWCAALLPKPQGGFRPLLLSHVFRRWALCVLTKLGKLVIETMAGDMQYGVGCSDGASKLTNTLRALVVSDLTRVVLAIDIKAAFQKVARSTIHAALRK